MGQTWATQMVYTHGFYVGSIWVLWEAKLMGPMWKIVAYSSVPVLPISDSPCVAPKWWSHIGPTWTIQMANIHGFHVGPMWVIERQNTWIPRGKLLHAPVCPISGPWEAASSQFKQSNPGLSQQQPRAAEQSSLSRTCTAKYNYLNTLHRENSPVTQTTPEPTLLSWGGLPRGNFPPHPRPHSKPALIAFIWPFRPYCSQSPLILLRRVTEIKFAQNLRWLGNLTLELVFPAHCISNWKLNGISRTNISKVTFNAANERARCRTDLPLGQDVG